MNLRSIGHVTGLLLLITSGALLLPVGCSLLHGDEGDLTPLLTAAALAALAGFPPWYLMRGENRLGVKDALVLATLGWTCVSAVSALPFVLHGSIPSFTDAFFEMLSGYTTTGATILTDIESLPHGLLFWRSETSLIGGLGFLTLTIIFLPQRMVGPRIFRADASPGQVMSRKRFTPQTRQIILQLWAIYLTLNGLQIIAMSAGGVPLFDACCIAFGTVATAGFATHRESLGQLGSAYLEWVVILFMFLGGTTLMLFHQLLQRRWRVLRVSTELRWYAGISLAFCTGVTLSLWHGGTLDPAGSIRHGTFQVLSLLTTTGFTTADYEQWPQLAQMLLYTVCFIGACTGSTTSGIRIIHYAVICKFMSTAIKKIFLQPLAAESVRVDGRPVGEMAIAITVCYFIMNIFMVLIGGCLLSLLDGLDFTSAMSAVVSCSMNIGPGFGEVGPSENYAFISGAGKWFLAWTMLVGRLEVFTALVIFYPAFWRK